MKVTIAPQLTDDPYSRQSTETVACSPLSLNSDYQRMYIEMRPPHIMPSSHWHGQLEVNIPFDGDVEYLFNNETVRMKQGYITLFWACIPHQLTKIENCRNMAIFNIPMHLFLLWPLDRELINNITHGRVIKSRFAQQIGKFEIRRWQREINSEDGQIQQLAIDEMTIMLKRFCLSGWTPVSVNKISKVHNNKISGHAQFYVSQMLEYISHNYHRPVCISEIANHVRLNPNYTMGIFQRVMQLTIKQYITIMRVNHARALLSDTDKSILDIMFASGFDSSSRFYHAFKKYTGIPPQQYRNNAQRFHLQEKDDN